MEGGAAVLSVPSKLPLELLLLEDFVDELPVDSFDALLSFESSLF